MYRDIPIIEEVRELFNKTVQRANITPPSIDESVKWLNHYTLVDLFEFQDFWKIHIPRLAF